MKLEEGILIEKVYGQCILYHDNWKILLRKAMEYDKKLNKHS